MKLLACIAIGGLLVAGTAVAEITKLPNYAYRAVGEAGVAAGISPLCRGIRVQKAGVQASMEAMYARLEKDGYPPEAVMAHFDTPKGRAHVEAWINGWQKRHGARDTSLKDQCDAIRAEARSNQSFATQVRIRN